jgi:hypothetical protein
MEPPGRPVTSITAKTWAIAPARRWAGRTGSRLLAAHPEQTAHFLALAARLGLFVTGGSDFHGRSKPHVHLGVVHDGWALPDELLEALRRGVPA